MRHFSFPRPGVPARLALQQVAIALAWIRARIHSREIKRSNLPATYAAHNFADDASDHRAMAVS